MAAPSGPAGSIQVDITNLQAILPVDAGWLRAIVAQLLRAEGIATADLSVVVVDDAGIRGINARHLDHDRPTDVISFAFGAPGDADFGGELVVSAETAAREAAARQVPPRDELALYVVHGLLHLCGFDDRTEADAQAMRAREGEWLRDLGIDNPFGRDRVGAGTTA
jgi:probable rRNA maturation factor